MAPTTPTPTVTRPATAAVTRPAIVAATRRPAAGVVCLLITAAGLALAACGGSSTATSGPSKGASPAASAASGTAPAAGPQQGPVSTGWGAPADPSAAARAAGLPMLGEEKLAVHYHAHLDVIINGQPVPVPAELGVDEVKHLIAPLHTHDPSGVVHVESATDVPFTLGQVFTEWGQPLHADRVGPVAVGAGQVLRVYRNGQPVSGDPAALVLHGHDEIVVWVGPADQQPQVPSSYTFPAGL